MRFGDDGFLINAYKYPKPDFIIYVFEGIAEMGLLVAKGARSCTFLFLARLD